MRVGYGSRMTNPQIVVNGQGRAEGTPDRCVLHAALNVMAPTAAEAIAQLSVVVLQVLDALSREEVIGSDVRTENLGVQDFFDQRQQKVTARVGSYQLEVVIDDLDRVGPILAVLTTAAGDSFQVRALQLAMKDPEPLRREARAAAVKDARAKAEQIAAAADVRLGRLVMIEDVQSLGSRGVPVGYQMRASSGGTIIPSVPVEPGSAAVVETVRATYEANDDGG